jgi:UDP-N-acetyl-D-glucosamine/UDP-N-acetyl-D-galactosamine dehydrogenase
MQLSPPSFDKKPKIAVIGLGYVGLPLAVALAKHFTVLGFDIDQKRIEELNSGFDRTHEIDSTTLKKSKLSISSQANALLDQHIYIVTVPTPVTADNSPDLKPLEGASITVAKALSKGAIVVYESTVYPGVTEDFCGPILEKISGLKCGEDFYLGYSPERINPGDKEHTVERITKVVSGQTQAVAEQLKMVYGTLNKGNIFVAANIKTAEAAKVIENAQRDINIAFVNEIATIVGKLGISIYDVLDAASTKWNFLNFKPGLVGGHCIGVDPYYLAHCARQVQHEPEIILAGRRTNEGMGDYIANSINSKLHEMGKKGASRILVLGLTFKENIPDLRNSKVIDVIRSLRDQGHEVTVHDVHANPMEAKLHYDIDLLDKFVEHISENLHNPTRSASYDCIVGAVSHDAYLNFSLEQFEQLLKPDGLIADIKNMWKNGNRPKHLNYWSL